MRRLSRQLNPDLSNHDTLIEIRKRVRNWDRAVRYMRLSWLFFFLVHRIKLDGIRSCRVEVLPQLPGRRHSRTMLYIHGGGFFFRILSSQAQFAARICRHAGISHAYIPRYRLAPEHHAPAALDDIVTAYKALLAKGYRSKDIVLAGDSAGGGLLLSALMRLRDESQPMPACGVLFSPVTDLSLSGPSYLNNRLHDPVLGNMPAAGTEFYSGNTPLNDPSVSPVFGDFSQLPPLMIQVGSHERLLDDSLRLQANATAAGTVLTIEVWQHMPHVWQLFPLPESRRAIKRVGAFIRGQLTLAPHAVTTGDSL